MSKYKFLPSLSNDERRALHDSIATFGVLQAFVTDEDGEVIDGDHRAEVADELSIEYGTVLLPGLTEEQMIEQALALNFGRRSLSPEQKRSPVELLKQRNLSVRRISDKTGIPRSTVHRLAGVPDGTPEYVTGQDGKRYRARRPMDHETARAMTEFVKAGIHDLYYTLARIHWLAGRAQAERAVEAWVAGGRGRIDDEIVDDMHDRLMAWVARLAGENSLRISILSDPESMVEGLKHLQHELDALERLERDQGDVLERLERQ